MAYIGNQLQTAQPNYQIIDDISGSFDGTTTTFALQVGGVTPTPFPVSAQHCIISVGGVVQEPDPTGTNGFLLSGSNIVFSSAPSSGESFFGTVLAGADYINVGASFPDGSVANPSITFDQDLDTGLYRSASGTTSISANGTNVADFGPSQITFNNGNVGIGTTNPIADLHVKDSSSSASVLVEDVNGGRGYFIAQTNGEIDIYRGNEGTGADKSIRLRANDSSGTIQFQTGGGTERLRIDSSGRLLVGTSSTPVSSTVVLEGRSGATNSEAILRLCRGQDTPADGATLGDLSFGDSNNGDAARIFAQRDGGTWTSSSSRPSRLVFSTTADGASSPTVRYQIDRRGQSISMCDGTPSVDHLFTTEAAGSSSTKILAFRNSATSGSAGSGSEVCVVRRNGDLDNANNSYGPLVSDIKYKENIIDAGPQWDDFKAIRFRKFNFKPETGFETFTQLGVIAQEVELVSPGLIIERPDLDENDNDLGTTTKTVKSSILTMKALIALQEAMERIETLEASNAALEARLTALEGGAS
jgi:hypothetical protein